jgi:hypothetical protein
MHRREGNSEIREVTVMNWVFWALLIVGLVLLISPFLGIVEAAVSTALWVVGGLILLAAIVWAVTTLGRTTAASTRAM